MRELKDYATKNRWWLVKRVLNPPVITELYGRPQ